MTFNAFPLVHYRFSQPRGSIVFISTNNEEPTGHEQFEYSGCKSYSCLPNAGLNPGISSFDKAQTQRVLRTDNQQQSKDGLRNGVLKLLIHQLKGAGARHVL